jgi:hypothetical protein
VTLQLSLKEFLTSKPLGSSWNATPLSSKLGSTFGLQSALRAAGAFTIVPIEFAMQEPATSFHHSEQQR